MFSLVKTVSVHSGEGTMRLTRLMSHTEICNRTCFGERRGYRSIRKDEHMRCKGEAASPRCWHAAEWQQRVYRWLARGKHVRLWLDERGMIWWSLEITQPHNAWICAWAFIIANTWYLLQGYKTIQCAGNSLFFTLSPFHPAADPLVCLDVGTNLTSISKQKTLSKPFPGSGAGALV